MVRLTWSQRHELEKHTVRVPGEFDEPLPASKHVRFTKVHHLKYIP